MADLKVGCSPLTSRIFVGTVKKYGTWGSNRTDVTDEAVSSVAQHLIQVDEMFVFDYNGERYTLKVDKNKNYE